MNCCPVPFASYLTYASTKFEVATSNSLVGDALRRKITLFDLDLGVKVTRNITRFPLYHTSTYIHVYTSSKFEVATTNGWEEGIIKRNVKDRRTNERTYRRTDDGPTGIGTKLIYPIYKYRPYIRYRLSFISDSSSFG